MLGDTVTNSNIVVRILYWCIVAAYMIFICSVRLNVQQTK